MITPGTLITLFHPTSGIEIVATIEKVEVQGRSTLYHITFNTDKGIHRSLIQEHEIISIVEKIMVFQELGD